MRIFKAAILGVALLFAGFPSEASVIGDRASFVGGRQHAGEVLDVDLPQAEHIKNIGSKVDGAGMCVSSSIEMAFRWAGVEEMRGFRDWCANDAGGSWPEKTDRQIQAYCKQKGIPVPPYIQYEGKDPRPVIEAALKSGRMACITYGWSPRYPGESYIAHMTSLAKFGGRFATVLDNNFPGENAYEWMDLDELIRRCVFPRGTGWVFVPLASPPPPSPKNP